MATKVKCPVTASSLSSEYILSVNISTLILQLVVPTLMTLATNSMILPSGIDLSKSIMVGDRAKDIEAAKNAHCPSVFIDYGYNETKPVDQNYTVDSVKGLLTCLEKHFESN